jgi:hypothetical protein
MSTAAFERKMWHKVVISLAAIEVQAKGTMSLQQLEDEVKTLYMRRLDTVMSNSCPDITVGEDELVPSFPSNITREQMESQLVGPLWRLWKDIKKIIINDISSAFITFLNSDGNIPSGHLLLVIFIYI